MTASGAPMRVGWGFDAHRFGGDGPLVLGGVVVSDRGLVATSDGDLLAHAVADAVLGAAALGDIGRHFPSSDDQWHGADSMELLGSTVRSARAAGWVPATIDVTVVAEGVRVSPHRQEIRRNLAAVLGIPIEDVSVKATTTDGMGFIGAEEGMAAVAVAVLTAV